MTKRPTHSQGRLSNFTSVGSTLALTPRFELWQAINGWCNDHQFCAPNTGAELLTVRTSWNIGDMMAKYIEETAAKSSLFGWQEERRQEERRQEERKRTREKEKKQGKIRVREKKAALLSYFPISKPAKCYSSSPQCAVIQFVMLVQTACHLSSCVCPPRCQTQMTNKSTNQNLTPWPQTLLLFGHKRPASRSQTCVHFR